jgi:hypothetical protein
MMHHVGYLYYTIKKLFVNTFLNIFNRFLYSCRFEIYGRGWAMGIKKWGFFTAPLSIGYYFYKKSACRSMELAALCTLRITNLKNHQL